MMNARKKQTELLARSVPIDRIIPDPNQPRRDLDEEDAKGPLEALAYSIREHGILQPIVLRPLPDGRHALVAGERRWRAAALAGLKEVPAVIREDLEGASLEMAQLAENLQRESLSDIDVAVALRGIMERYPEMRKKDLALALNRNPSYITRMMSMLDERWSGLVADGVLTWATVLERFKALPEDSRRRLEALSRSEGRPVNFEDIRREARTEPAAPAFAVGGGAAVDADLGARLLEQLGPPRTPDAQAGKGPAALPQALDASYFAAAPFRNAFTDPGAAGPARIETTLAEAVALARALGDAAPEFHCSTRVDPELAAAALRALGAPVPRDPAARILALKVALRSAGAS